MKTWEKKKKHAKYVVHLNLFLFLSKEKSYLTKADRLTYSDKAVPYTTVEQIQKKVLYSN